MTVELSAEAEAALQEQLEPEEQLLLEVDKAEEVQMVTRSGFSPNGGRGPSQQGVRATTSTCWPCCRCQCRWQPRAQQQQSQRQQRIMVQLRFTTTAAPN